MEPRARHPEVVALALIVLLLGVGANPGHIIAAPDDCSYQLTDFQSRLLEKMCEIETRVAERLAAIGERIGARLGSRSRSRPESIRISHSSI